MGQSHSSIIAIEESLLLKPLERLSEGRGQRHAVSTFEFLVPDAFAE